MQHIIRAMTTGSGSGTPRLNPEGENIAVIIGESTISGIYLQDNTNMPMAAASEDRLIM